MERITEFLLNALTTNIREMIQNFLLRILDAEMGLVQDIVGSLWTDDIINAIVNASTGVSLAVFAVGCIVLMLDVVEARAEEKQIYMSSVVKNFIVGLAFATFGPRFMLSVSFSVLKLTEQARLLGNIETMRYNLSDSLDLAMGVTSDVANFLLVFVIALIGSAVFIWKGCMRWMQLITTIAIVPLYEISVVRGDQTAFSAWFRQSMAISLTFFFEYFFYFLGVGLIVEQGGRYLLGAACFIGMGGVSKALDKYGMSTGGSGFSLTGAAHLADTSARFVSTVKGML